jgi:hypothetical protein
MPQIDNKEFYSKGDNNIEVMFQSAGETQKPDLMSKKASIAPSMRSVQDASNWFSSSKYSADFEQTDSFSKSAEMRFDNSV